MSATPVQATTAITVQGEDIAVQNNAVKQELYCSLLASMIFDCNFASWGGGGIKKQ